MIMTSSRPYIVRGLYEWILENSCTPYLLVNAMADRVEVPRQFVKDGQIVLNISPVAVRDLLVADDDVQFNGRFGGVPMDIYVPMSAVMGIYARENGQGMIFDLDEGDVKPPTPEGSDPTTNGPKLVKKSPQTKTKSPGLRIVK